MKVLYLRSREGRHSTQPIVVTSARQLRHADAAMLKIGFRRQGTQVPLPLDQRTCIRCGCTFDKGVHLQEESWCRRCIRVAFGGERG